MAIVELISINDIEQKNYSIKCDDEVTFHKVKQYIKDHGQIENVIVTKPLIGKYRVLKGSSILRALVELDFQFVNVVNFGDLAPDVALFHYIKLCTLRRKTDSLELAFLMKNILANWEKSELVKVLPFSTEELDAFENIFTFDWSQYDDVELKNQAKLF